MASVRSAGSSTSSGRYGNELRLPSRGQHLERPPPLVDRVRAVSDRLEIARESRRHPRSAGHVVRQPRRPRVRPFQSIEDRRPIRRCGQVESPLEAVPHAFEQLRDRPRIAAQRRDERLERAGIDRAARDEPGDLRDAAPRRVVQRHGRVCAHHRFDREPHHRREIRIGGILFVCEQLCGNRPANRRVEPLQRGREIEAHDRRAIVLRHPRELSEDLRRWRPILGEQLDGPRANVLVTIAERIAERRGRPSAGDVQRPHRSKPDVGIVVVLEHRTQAFVRSGRQRALRRRGAEE